MSKSQTPPLEPFSATIGAFGNTQIWIGGGFEPIVFRNRFTALEDSPDRIVVVPELLSKYDSLREGFFDDAEARVYRIEDGKFRLVRRDSVAPGGSRMSGWVPLLREHQMVAPSTSNYTLRWDDWNRSDAPYYFTVRAVDRQGHMSAPAAAIAVHRQKGVATPGPGNTLIATPTKSSAVQAALHAPQNLRLRFSDGGNVQLEWDPVGAPNLAGYAIYRSDYPPERHLGHYIKLEQHDKSPPIKAGDMVIVSKKFYQTSRTRQLSNRVWGAEGEFRQILPGLVQSFPDESPSKRWHLVKHESDTTVVDGGETYLKLQLEGGTREALSIYNHAGTQQSYYDVLEQRPYRVEVWLRQEGQGSVRFALSGFYSSGPQIIPPIKFTPGSKWKKFTATFIPKVLHTGNQPGQMLLEFTGPGTFSVDNFRVYRADTGYLDFLPEEAQAIRSSAMQALRTHGPIKTGLRTYDMVQFTNAGGVIEGIRKGNTLPQMLSGLQKVGVRPWLQMEYHMAPEEWLGLVEYLAAPYSPDRDSAQSKPWAYKRYTQGRREPWTADFDRIYFELGNETWNQLFRPWTFDAMRDASTGRFYSPGQVYGLFQEYVISILKSSPWWKSEGLDNKIQFVLSGHAANPRYGQDAAATSLGSTHLTMGAYIGGWDESEGPPTMKPRSFFYVLNQISQMGMPAAEQLLHATVAAKEIRKKPIKPGTYEAGPGYAMNGLNGARVSPEQAHEQELVMKSIAAGTATLDAFLSRARLGFTLQNYFTFGSGPRWTSHTRWHEGGGAHPAWMLLALFNREVTGAMLQVNTLSVPTVNTESMGRRKALRDAPLIATYAIRAKDRYAIVLISRKVPDYPYQGDAGFSPVTLDLPFMQARSVTLFRIPGAPDASRHLSTDIELARTDLGPFISGPRLKLGPALGAPAHGLPPGATYLYVFDGTSNGPSSQP